jgi:ubiquinone/menaquinone biosynthesis C-methylase UbiE
VSERETYARSFGSVAELYEEARPPYADAAVDWLAERLPLRDVLDLAAGTGKLTRQLLERGAHVVALEPDPDMRATFARVLPDVELVDGRAEAIPLADGSVDVVAVGQAFHWFEPDRALAEMHRVTRPGGGFALLWNAWHDDDPILSRIDALLRSVRPPASTWHERYRRGLFGALEERRFEQRRRLTADQLVGWAASTSGFVRAPREEQERLTGAIREIVGGEAAEVTIATLALAADRA